MNTTLPLTLKSTRGFTLVELLLSLGLLGIITVALLQTFGNTVQASNSVTATNDLLREGQIAQQIVNARLREACYLYPDGTTVTPSTGGATTKNWFAGAGSPSWTVNTHPIVAMLVPGDPIPLTGPATQRNYTFFAYFPMPRVNFVTAVTGANNPGGDTLNDNSTWVLLEARQAIVAPIATSCQAVATGNNAAANMTADASSVSFTGLQGRLLVDYLRPVTTYSDLFSVGAGFVDYNLQFQRTTLGGGTARVGGGGASNLSGRVYSQNLGL